MPGISSQRRTGCRTLLTSLVAVLAASGGLLRLPAARAEDAAPKTPPQAAATAEDVNKIPFATLAKQFPDVRGVGGIFIFNPDTDKLPPSPDPHTLTGMWRITVGHQTLRPERGARPDGFAPYTDATYQTVLDRLRKAYVGTPVAEAAVYCEPVGVVRHVEQPLLMHSCKRPSGSSRSGRNTRMSASFT
jgi:hypothetical protein